MNRRSLCFLTAVALSSCDSRPEGATASSAGNGSRAGNSQSAPESLITTTGNERTDARLKRNGIPLEAYEQARLILKGELESSSALIVAFGFAKVDPRVIEGKITLAQSAAENTRKVQQYAAGYAAEQKRWERRPKPGELRTWMEAVDHPAAGAFSFLASGDAGFISGRPVDFKSPLSVYAHLVTAGGDQNRALQILTEAVKAHPENSWYSLKLAEIHLKAGDGELFFKSALSAARAGQLADPWKEKNTVSRLFLQSAAGVSDMDSEVVTVRTSIPVPPVLSLLETTVGNLKSRAARQADSGQPAAAAETLAVALGVAQLNEASPDIHERSFSIMSQQSLLNDFGNAMSPSSTNIPAGEWKNQLQAQMTELRALIDLKRDLTEKYKGGTDRNSFESYVQEMRRKGDYEALLELDRASKGKDEESFKLEY